MAADPLHTRRGGRSWIVAALLLGALAVAAVYWYWLDARERNLIAEIEAGSGAIILSTSGWDRVMGQFEGDRTGGRFASDNGALVHLRGTAFDNEWVRKHHYLTSLQIKSLNLTRSSVSGPDLARLIQSHPLESLYVDGLDLSADVAGAITAQPRLRFLHARGAEFSDESLSQLPLEQFEQLYVEQTQVTPGGLQELRRCTQLVGLGLDGKQLDSQTAGILPSLQRLRILNLVGPEVTDEHLRRVHGLRTLTVIYLVRTSATPAGVSELARSVPGCLVDVL